ncbi:natural resistance-associated macrophage protein [Cutaneotrichosporon oleaginosum]|uniref:Natural resistance-associated macrophage protein n=1 Tax=Cutaneotrichosporon oleaginosum TaxID=879819 RepID=A0A0J1B0E2_9TREE|nr:natural resistance-associated macrophage protein [Cutaneotrichosporon oleaginosum]KLT41064.1 natural resistance-associated macrophage protein [Cutaneotrichosporon oleaginosum]TXT12154.1 hypothetical protein COLE_02564 [Cutaneotrichosporon oleaginosum]
MFLSRLKTAKRVLTRHAAFIGPGLVAAVAYVDPGNWATDLEAGARWGYKLLFIVFVAGLAAVCLQVMSVRLGAVTSKSLPRNTRELILGWEARWPQYRRWWRTLLYSLWVIAEIAIIATDLAELIGSAIALNLLFPKLPLWAGVLITAVDVMIVLIFFRSDSGRQGMLLFEIVIVALVLAVFVSFMILLDMIKPVWRDVFYGLVPSKTLFAPGALYVGIGIIGATVMPHALFLGSALAGVDRLNMLPRPPKRRRERTNNRLPALNPAAAIRRRLRPQRQETDPEIPLENVEGREHGSSTAHDSAPPPQLPLVKTSDKDDEYESKMQEYEKAIRKFDRIRWVNLHVWHASVDTAYSLLGFALTINSSILTLAGATFFYGETGASADDADLSGAHKLVSEYVGKAAGIIFALALLCAGQSASITATLAGQIVSEGFLEWKTSPMVRRLITRLIGVVPAAIVASAVGNKGLNTMLVASQVILCIVLPTVTIPLVYMCSRKDIMVVEGPIEEEAPRTESREERGKTDADEVEELDIADSAGPCPRPVSPSSLLPRHSAPPTRVPSPDVVADEEPAPGRRRKYFTSPKWYSGLGWLLNLVLVLANGYVIVTLAMGQS